jgi:WD40 repeat protein
VLVTAGEDNQVRRWRIPECTLLGTMSHGATVNAIAFNRAGTVLATAGDDHLVQIWDGSDRRIGVLAGHVDWVIDVAFSANDKLAVTSSADGTVRVWNMATSRITNQFWVQPDETVWSARFLSDASDIVLAAAGCVVQIVQVPTRAVLYSLNHPSGVNCVDPHPGGQFIATACHDGTIRIWSPTGTLIRIIKAHDLPISRISHSPNGHHLLSLSADYTARIWDTSLWELSATLTGHTDPIYGGCWSLDGKFLATASSSGIVGVWNSSEKIA